MTELVEEHVRDALGTGADIRWERDPESPCGAMVVVVDGDVLGTVPAPRLWSVDGRVDRADEAGTVDVTTLTFRVDLDAWRRALRQAEHFGAQGAREFLEQGWVDKDGGLRMARLAGWELAKAVGAADESEVTREEWEAFEGAVETLLPNPVDEDEHAERAESRAEHLIQVDRVLARLAQAERAPA